jgi:hypothetical protein
VLIGSFPLFYSALYSVIAFAHALVPSRATRSWRKIALRQEPHQPFQILGSRGQQELFGNIPQSAQPYPPQSHSLFELGKECFDLKPADRNEIYRDTGNSELLVRAQFGALGGSPRCQSLKFYAQRWRVALVRG